MRKFFKEFIKSPKSVWSIIPSSSKLIHSMLKNIDFSRDLTIVEFWPWIWNFTKELLKRSSKNTSIYVFEIQDNFVEDLKKINDPRLKVIHAWAENICEVVWCTKADVIVSWLPFGSLPKWLTENILNEAHKWLRSDWLFLQFQYFLQNKKDIKNVFWNHSISWQPINFPPAFIYKCHKLDEKWKHN